MCRRTVRRTVLVLILDVKQNVTLANLKALAKNSIVDE